jgi:hypothetical protein
VDPVSAEEYQRAFGDLLRSPALCVALRHRETPRHREPVPGSSGDDPLDGYQLTARERARLYAVSAHRGLVVNCMLYRAGRLVGITRRLPVEALGPALRPVFDDYLAAQPDAEPEFDREALRFAAFAATHPALDALDAGVRELLAAESGLIARH